MKKIILPLTALLALCSALPASPIFRKTVSERELFRTERFGPSPDADYGSFRLVNTSVKTDGAVLRGWILLNKKSSGLIIYYYGNSETVRESRERLFFLAGNTGFDILCLDYRGYGASSGSPSIDSLLADSLAIYDAFAPFYMDIFIYGHSLGTIPALHTAIERRVNGVVLEAAFTTAKEAIPGTAYHLPEFLKGIIAFEASEELINRKPQQSERISSLKSPLLLLHGSKDRMFPVSMAEKMHKNAGSRKKFLTIIENAGHNNLDLTGEAASGALSDFLKKFSGNPFKTHGTAMPAR